MTNMDEARQVDAPPGLDATVNGGTYENIHTDSSTGVTETQGTPFERSYAQYRAAGWLGTLHIPMGRKSPPPTGYTGYDGAWPTDAEAAIWSGNIGLRMPTDVIGIDVDDYESKHGASQLAEIEQRLCPLPPTWSSTRRGWGESRIRFYRVPDGKQ